MQTQILTIISQSQIADKTFKLVAEGAGIDRQILPGQFAHLRVTAQLDPLLRRPISICDVNATTSQVTFVHRASGKGTELLSRMEPGDKLDALIPLGNGFPLPTAEAKSCTSSKECLNGSEETASKAGTALLIGGGVGVPPLYYLGKILAQRGVKVISILGFRTKNEVFFTDEFAAFGEVLVSTDDGSMGRRGRVTDLMEALLGHANIIYACGPKQMLAAVTARRGSIPTYISLEERLGCGVGACYGCTCTIDDASGHRSYRKVCVDGPVFDAEEVVL